MLEYRSGVVHRDCRITVGVGSTHRLCRSTGVRQYSEQENTGGRQGGQSSLKPGIA